MLVHGYDDVDIGIVRDVVEHRLDDLLAFVASVRRWMAGPRPTGAVGRATLVAVKGGGSGLSVACSAAIIARGPT